MLVGCIFCTDTKVVYIPSVSQTTVGIVEVLIEWHGDSNRLILPWKLT